ncbi:hypothetical protein Thimo_3170 [Thioflavicoccus mobilis 8321]|uniref:Uncharacterized protein n=1 Tax=Thioflavicoccus mobilis 8321 TaxID=765912 RepID=L0H2H0_9GAMM|nr:hypothetical protein Thimo_3170 [Thioflavicoccus mobilis 8321]
MQRQSKRNTSMIIQGQPIQLRVRGGPSQERTIDQEARDLEPHNMSYYLERRGPAIKEKVRDVLIVYREVAPASYPGHVAR